MSIPLDKENITDLQSLGDIDTNLLSEISAICLSNLKNGTLLLPSSAKINKNLLKKYVVSLSKVFINLAKNNHENFDFNSIFKNKFSDSNLKFLNSFYKNNKILLRNIVFEQSDILLKYTNQFIYFSYRFSLEFGNRSCLHFPDEKLYKPILIIQLGLSNKTYTFLCDYNNLLSIREKLNKAHSELKSVHAQRVQKYIR